MTIQEVREMCDTAQNGDTPAARRSARISAARAIVKADKRLGLTTPPAIVTLANAVRRTDQVATGTKDGNRAAS